MQQNPVENIFETSFEAGKATTFSAAQAVAGSTPEGHLPEATETQNSVWIAYFDHKAPNLAPPLFEILFLLG